MLPKKLAEEKEIKVSHFGKILDRNFVNLWRRVRRIVGPYQADSILATSLNERRELFAKVRARNNPDDAVPTRFDAYEIHNRITASAQNYPLLERRRLEDIGGSMLKLGDESLN